MEKFLSNFKPAVKQDESTLEGLIPWTEKYRPKTINDVSQQEEVIKVISKCIDGADFPNLLFYGPPGTGKTSTILALAKQLYGKKHFKDRVLELNASDERGINVVRERIKRFSKTSMNTEGSAKDLVPFKLIILDEADSMTSAAQAALRRTMEVDCKTTRFCLICNYITRIINPIVSRCAKFRFKPLESVVAVERLSFICQSESLNISKSSLLRLVSLVEGDLRRAITVLQSASFMKQTGEEGDNNLSELFFSEIVGEVPEQFIDKFLELVLKKSSFELVINHIKTIIATGYSVAQFVSQLHDSIMSYNDIKPILKCKIFERLAMADAQLMAGSDEFLQLISLASFIMKSNVL